MSGIVEWTSTLAYGDDDTNYHVSKYIHPPKWEPEEEEPDYCMVCDRVLVDDDDATHDSEIAGGLVCAACCPECARVKVV